MFITCSRKPRSATTARLRAAFRPRIEVLEDRSVPSAGALDPMFGSAGTVITPFSATEDVAYSLALQNDGKVVVAGYSYDSGSGALALARYDANGALDSSFGAGGRVVTDVNPKQLDSARAVAVDYSGTSATNPHYGKIYVAGTTYRGSSGVSAPVDAAFVVVRYHANGTLDTSFGDNKAKGKVIINFTSGDEVAYGLAVQADGKVAVAGVGVGKYHLARLTPAGSLDTTFGNKGLVSTSVGIAVNGAQGDMILQSDGKIVVVGNGSDLSTGANVSVLARYLSNGTLDSTFGSAGLATVHGVLLRSAAVQSGNKVVAVGSTYVETAPGTHTQFWAIARFTANGVTDGTFGAGGVLVPNIRGGANGIAVDATDRIVVTGHTLGVTPADNGQTYSDTVLLRLTPAGGLDASFGENGLARADISPYGDSPSDVILQPDGKIITAGYAITKRTPTVDFDFALARFLPAAPSIGSFTASSYAVPSGQSVTLTATDVVALNTGTTVTRVTFYYLDFGGQRRVLGYGAQTATDVWEAIVTVNLSPGRYTLLAEAMDSYGAISDSLTLTLDVL